MAVDRDRLYRAFSQRMFLVTYKDAVFAIMGSVGNVYDVSMNNPAKPTCTCPDFLKRKRACKHILFVLVRVHGVPAENCDDPDTILNALALGPVLQSDVEASPACKRAYAAAIEGQYAVPQAVEARTIEDDCPICYESIGTSEEKVHCTVTCGKSLHASCMENYSRFQESHGNPVLCPFCRSPWNITVAAQLAPDGYICIHNTEEEEPE